MMIVQMHRHCFVGAVHQMFEELLAFPKQCQREARPTVWTVQPWNIAREREAVGHGMAY